MPKVHYSDTVWSQLLWVWFRTRRSHLPVLHLNWRDEGNNDRSNLPKLWLKETSGRTRHASHHRQNIQCINYEYGIREVSLVMWTPEKGFTDESIGYWITRMKNQMFPLCGSVTVLPRSQTNHLVGFQSVNDQNHNWLNSKGKAVWNTVTGSLLLYPFIFTQSGSFCFRWTEATIKGNLNHTAHLWRFPGAVGCRRSHNAAGSNWFLLSNFEPIFFSDCHQ